MGTLSLNLSGMVLLCLLPASVLAQASVEEYPYERLIQDYIDPYDLSPDNQLRLSMYAELKGVYSSQYQSLALTFGSLGKLTFYQGNCLLRTANNRVYHLDQRRPSERGIATMNEALQGIFDKILLLSNNRADPDLIAFVDDALSRKNIEPFQKMYLRHVLIRYGYYDKEYNRVIFHTDWLPDQNYAYRGPGDVTIVDRPIEPLKVKLDAGVVRGYYLNSGGTVYVENVDREVGYATGEQYDYNVHAFKLFAQRLFTQTTQYIVEIEQMRLDVLEGRRTAGVVRDVHHRPVSVRDEAESTPLLAQNYGSPRGLGKTRGHSSVASEPLKSQPTQMKKTSKATSSKLARMLPYSRYDWIPMMLAQLRSRGINIGDPDIIQYFIDDPDFHHLYNLLTPKEREKVDRAVGE